eukprot:CAMPEP_0170509886 /NCGR_PEP_ID=MMETSP0208-20121228/65459_1 /TAXON_ID=197538 /ORGANISM="Strombidium inclinatum, Strain S3" /LENGTH=271 /DNA_ID=CAMNT_0010793287 /DNA_START=804 /DNA_END=1622 /DNA_ORIENTATION=-
MRKHLDSVALQNAFQKDVEERVKKEKAAINSTSPFEVRSLLVDPELYHLHAVKQVRKYSSETTLSLASSGSSWIQTYTTLRQFHQCLKKKHKFYLRGRASLRLRERARHPQGMTAEIYKSKDSLFWLFNQGLDNYEEIREENERIKKLAKKQESLHQEKKRVTKIRDEARSLEQQIATSVRADPIGAILNLNHFLWAVDLKKVCTARVRDSILRKLEGRGLQEIVEAVDLEPDSTLATKLNSLERLGWDFDEMQSDLLTDLSSVEAELGWM